MSENARRNRDICNLLDTKKVSYAVIAKMMVTPRQTVSGVAFRRRWPPSTRTRSPNSDGPNKIGHGYQPKSYQPKKTIRISL